MEGHGRSWKVMEGHGRSWKIMENHGKSWKVMEGHAVMYSEIKYNKPKFNSAQLSASANA